MIITIKQYYHNIETLKFHLLIKTLWHLNVFLLSQMAAYAAKLRDLESLFSDMDGGLKPANNAEIDAALIEAMEQVDAMMEDAKQLKSKAASYLCHHLKVFRTQYKFAKH